VEAAAVAKEQKHGHEERPHKPFRAQAEALLRALDATGLVPFAELQQSVTQLEAAGQSGAGPRIVARAWTDAAFCARLLADAPAACAELGLATSNYAAAGDVSLDPLLGARRFPIGCTVLQALQNTPTEHHLVVCTLCSCVGFGFFCVRVLVV
jgi:nitrile hydratase